MKYSHIGLVALASVLIAGCGGGSDTREKELEGKVTALEKQVEDLEKRPTESQAAAREQTARQQGEADGNQRAEAAEGKQREAEEKLQVAEQEARGKANQLRQNNARRVLEGLNAHDASSESGQAGTSTPAVTPRYQASALVTTVPPLSAPKVTTPGPLGEWFRTSITSRDFVTIDRLDVYSDVEAPKRVSFRESIYNDGTSDDGIPNTGDLIVVSLYTPSSSAASTTEVIDSTNAVVRSIGISDGASTHTNVSGVVASPFPKSGEPEKTFAVVDRGAYTRTEIDAGKEAYRLRNDNDPGNDPSWPDHCPNGCESSGFPDRTANPGITLPRTVRNDKRYPLRWTYETAGSIAGASGTFTCASGGVAAPEANPAPPANACGVTNQNTHFVFNGPWVFTPNRGATIQVDDAEYMYFGWWARQTNPNNSAGTWTFRTFHGPAANGNRSTADEVARLSGTVTYKGPAVGQYSFFQPLGGGHSHYGEFTANATLTANFTDSGDGSGAQEETVSGTIDGFKTLVGESRTPVDRSDWVLTLRQRNIASGIIPPTGADSTSAVTWLTNDNPTAAPAAGTWEAAFYSN
ncbi:MAG: hypothetical protein OXC25_03895, partial [Thiotrichales bacterium]|nr:hypothetical protein [Thiotrichales bacterium]